jgi:tRNA (guanine10-N2)-dimethyltransferase
VAWAVLLSGEHATLPAAELRALLDVHARDARVRQDGPVAVVHGTSGVEAALARMALAHAWGTFWGEAPDTPDGLAELEALVRRHCDGHGSLAVASERRGHTKSANSLLVERRLGAAAQAAGHRIDLKAPERTLFAWLVDGRVVVGERHGLGERGRFEARISDKRPHFSPIALHPRRAASLLHLARVKPGGRVLDPFCGTGTFVLEAALEGYDAWGSDLDAWMVQGTLQTLTDVPPEPLLGNVFVADVADVPLLLGQVDGIVTDLPYGRASTGHDEELAALYKRAFAAFAALLPEGAHAVIGHSDAALLEPVAAAGFAVTEVHEERAHRSLNRRFAVCRRL